MATIRLAALIVFLATLESVDADWWTNQAGGVVEATLDGFDGARVTLVRTNGAVLRLPLSALSAADQRRARLQSAQSIAPAFVQTAYADARSVLDRFDCLPAHQQTPEARRRAVHMARSVFDARIKARATELEDKTVLEEVRRLRSSLGNLEQNQPGPNQSRSPQIGSEMPR